jgi:glycerol-3-phosphate acyltransferase PlsY
LHYHARFLSDEMFMSDHSYYLILFILFSYLLGSLSSAIIVCKILRLPDPRTQGSHNPGATNVMRIGGKTAASFTLLGDVLKGMLPVLLAKYLGVDALPLALIIFAAFIGHLFPIFFRFKGGKGVATLLGCLIALSWPASLCWLILWILVTFLFRYVSLASLTASLLAPFYIWYFTDQFVFVITFMVMGMLLLYRHRGNIVKLMNGTESRM